MKLTRIAIVAATLGIGSLVCSIFLGAYGSAFAQEAAAAAKPAGGGDEAGTSYKAKTVYDFEDDMVEGDLARPDGELVNSLGKTQHTSLIEIRKDFIPEMLKSLEDV
jgi:hypothetical protein